MEEYKPVRVDTAPSGAWSLELSANLTVVELAAIMGGLGFRTTAHPAENGNFKLVPVDAGAPVPTGEQLRDILEHGIPRLPALVHRSDLR